METLAVCSLIRQNSERFGTTNYPDGREGGSAESKQRLRQRNVDVCRALLLIVEAKNGFIDQPVAIPLLFGVIYLRQLYRLAY